MIKQMKFRWGFGLSAAAVATAIAVAAFIILAPKASDIYRIFESGNKIRSLHVTTFGANSTQPDEYWIQCDDQGQAEKARYVLQKTDDGEKLIAWTPDGAGIFFRGKNTFLLLKTGQIAPMLQNLLETSQPQLVMKKLQEGQRVGRVDVQTQEPQGQQTAALIIAKHTDKPQKEIYYVDRKADLITRMEYFGVEGTNEVMKSRTEFSDYNAPLDVKMFDLVDQMPRHVRMFDQFNQVIGVAQGELTDEQAAVATVRQFFQALKEKNYRQAGLINSGELPAYTRRDFSSFQVVKIISVGPAEAQTNCVKRGFRVPCKLEIVRPDGHQYVAQPSPYVRPGDVEAQPDRWNITGGVNLGERSDSSIVLNQP